jgi:F5/8 type C domain
VPAGSVQPEAVKPTTVRARPAAKAKTAPARVVNPGDLVCGQCGEGNDPGRKFCRRCGGSLQRATVFILPWYQRWWRKLTTRKTRAAGDRPASRRRAIGGAGPGWLTSGFMKVLGIAVVLLVLLTIVGPWRGHLRHDASNDYHRIFNDVHPKYNPVHPFAATATTSAAGHPAANAIDGAVNTSWQTNAPDNGIGQSLKIRLGAASNLDEIGFLSGDQDTPSSYLTEPRPEKVHLTAAGAQPYSKDLTLKDVATFQSFTIKAKDASSLTITIDSVYPSDQGKQASMAEVELFVKT